MKTSYEEFVHSVEDSTSLEKKAEKRGEELAKIRNQMKSPDAQGRPRLVAKLIYLEMEGENTGFGQMEIISLMANPNYSSKMVGYVGASVLTDSNSDTALLMTQTVVKDIENKSDQNIKCLGLAAVANIGGSDLISAAIPAITKELDSKYPKVIRYAASAALRAVRENIEYFENFKKYVPKLLNYSDHSIMLTGINLAIEMLKTVPSLPQQWKTFTRPFIDLLRDLKHSPPTKETEFHLFNDPFLQCQSLKALGLIGQKSDELDSLLQEIITDLDCHSNTARSILLEAAETVKKAGKSQSLKTLAINQIGRLLELKNSAVIYSALSAFSRLLLSNDIIDRTSSDSTAMQRYRLQIVKCLDHKDLSIRRRSLDVISAIINEQNVTKLVPEIIRYMKLVDTDFRSEIVPKIYQCVQRFSPDPAWNIDSTLHIIIDNSNFIGNDIISNFCNLLSKNIDLRSAALESLENVLTFYADNQPLIQIAAFCIGEYETRKVDVITNLLKVVVQPKQKSRTTCYILTALAKLATRFGGDMRTDVVKCLKKFSNDNRLDVQQRAGEMLRILNNPEYSMFLLPMNDEIDEQHEQHSTQKVQQQGIPDNFLDQSTTNNKSNNLIDLLDDEEPQNYRNRNQSRNQNNSYTFNVPKDAKLAIEQSDFVVFFEVQKNPQDLRQVAIRASFFNKTNIPLTKFNATFGVPDGWHLNAQAMSDTNLAPNGGTSINQILLLLNRGKSPLAMRAQINYMFRSQPISEKCQVNDGIFE
ncbi:Adaptin N terminal region family protein [Tritrichomonas foetus]|uniref:AP-1 complex subunit gamma n=1 Tax=Tritrichomonas foetus TaxID=1144522 RepID=A0A1J4K0I6_9EUKA|nr:Adaptin N terminal region family protein [Tritrichomonas foetus]|eukprot:OHT03254.1 Adaptin N terminal region family protein [Tritrichomonas foetus]